MLEKAKQKILGLFSMAQPEREIENVDYGSGSDWSVLKVHGREIYIPEPTRKDGDITVYITDLSNAFYCKFEVDLNDLSDGHGQPRRNTQYLAGPISEEDHDALVRMHDYFVNKDAEASKNGNPPSFKRELIRLYDPKPPEKTGSPPPIKSDAQPR